MSRSLTTRQVAERLNMSTQTVSQRAKAGDIPGASKVFGRWRFDANQLEAWIATRTTTPARWAKPTRGRP